MNQNPINKEFVWTRHLPDTHQTILFIADDDGDIQAGWTFGYHWQALVAFAIGGNNVVIDRSTGLLWVQDPINDIGAPFNATMNWANAVGACAGLTYAGFSDWRLPNIFEISSIIRYGWPGVSLGPPFVLQARFPNTQIGDPYWSSTTREDLTSQAWELDFNTAMSSRSVKSQTRWVRPVRGGFIQRGL